VMALLKILLNLPPGTIRRRLARRTCAEALARGWAHGTLDLHPPAGDVAPLAMLRLRLHELVEQCASLGVDLGDHYALVILDADTGSLGPDAREPVMREVARAAQRRFRGGETVAATESGRVIVLGARHPQLPGVVQSLLAEVQSRPPLAGHRACGWIEPLPSGALHHDALLDDLAR